MTNDNIVIKLIYIFFLGILVALLIGIGINTFYPEPKNPTYPITAYSNGSEQSSTQEIKKQNEYDKQIRIYNKKMKPYHRNVSIIALIFAVLLIFMSIILEQKLKIISDGIMLSGLFTLLYSLGRGLASGNNKYSFIVSTVSVVVVLYLGYNRFVRTTPLSIATKKD